MFNYEDWIKVLIQKISTKSKNACGIMWLFYDILIKMTELGLFGKE
jgi:hypothetical protein